MFFKQAKTEGRRLAKRMKKAKQTTEVVDEFQITDSSRYRTQQFFITKQFKGNSKWQIPNYRLICLVSWGHRSEIGASAPRFPFDFPNKKPFILRRRPYPCTHFNPTNCPFQFFCVSIRRIVQNLLGRFWPNGFGRGRRWLRRRVKPPPAPKQTTTARAQNHQYAKDKHKPTFCITSLLVYS